VASAQATATVSLPPSSGNIDTSNKFAWAANAGWVNLAPSEGGVTVHPGPNGYLSGYAWGENVGWINLGGGALATPPAPAYFSFTDKRLHGYAWGENIGWLNVNVISP